MLECMHYAAMCTYTPDHFGCSHRLLFVVNTYSHKNLFYNVNTLNFDRYFKF